MKQICTIKGLEKVHDYYYITTCGKVISISHNKQKIMKPDMNAGYQRINLYCSNRTKHFKIHRLVALAFIPNPQNKTDVNHIDEIKTHNYVKNLNWMTSKENSNYGTRNKRISNLTKGVSRKQTSGTKNGNYHSKAYYKTSPTVRGNFKISCKRHSWNFNNFEEVFADIWIYPDKTKRNRYFYIEKV